MSAAPTNKGTRFQGQVALVTGAAAGIGRATALAFAREGAKVVVTDVDAEGGEETVGMIRDECRCDAIFVQCDVTDPLEVERLLATTRHEYGRLDHVFNNAGIEGTPGKIHEMDPMNFERTMRVNLDGVWNCMRAQIPLMLENGKGSIVNCSSVAGLRGIVGMSAYAASKHAVIGLTKSAALDYAQQGIRVNAICPGVIKTAMIDRFTKGDKETEAALMASEPVGRMGRPEEVAEAVLWLCSTHSGFVTGTAIPVDGGWTAR